MNLLKTIQGFVKCLRERHKLSVEDKAGPYSIIMCDKSSRQVSIVADGFMSKSAAKDDLLTKWKLLNNPVICDSYGQTAKKVRYDKSFKRGERQFHIDSCSRHRVLMTTTTKNGGSISAPVTPDFKEIDDAEDALVSVWRGNANNEIDSYLQKRSIIAAELRFDSNNKIYAVQSNRNHPFSSYSITEVEPHKILMKEASQKNIRTLQEAKERFIRLWHYKGGAVPCDVFKVTENMVREKREFSTKDERYVLRLFEDDGTYRIVKIEKQPDGETVESICAADIPSLIQAMPCLISKWKEFVVDVIDSEGNLLSEVEKSLTFKIKEVTYAVEKEWLDDGSAPHVDFSEILKEQKPATKQ